MQGLLPLLALVIWLVPWRSWPVGFDVWRSLLVAHTWANSGFPARLEAAAGTGLDVAFGDQQLGFDAMLALLGGAGIDERWVAPMVWGLVTIQAAVLWWAMNTLRPGVGGRWLLVLPLLSQMWLFRITALRTMLLSTSFLILLVTLVALRAERRAPAWSLALPALLFAWCHGAVALPLAMWGAAAIGARFETGRDGCRWRDGLFVLSGIAIAAVVRPDFPANLRVWFDLNVGTPIAVAAGELEARPTELLPLSPRELLATEWTFLCALLWLGGVVWWRRGAVRWSIVAPTACACVAALLCRRMFELAVPLLLLSLAVSVGGRLSRGAAALAFGLACLVHAPAAAIGAEANRMRELRPAAEFLRERGRPGDLVFVADWGISSPLAWFLRGSSLRFTGMIDPVFSWSHDRASWLRWQDIRMLRDPEPLQTITALSARFVAFGLGDGPPGAPLGSTATSLRRAVAGAIRGGAAIDAWVLHPDRPDDPRNQVVFDLAPVQRRRADPSFR